MTVSVDALKKKVVKEFINFLCEVRKGYKPNYELLLEEISFIDLILYNEIDRNTPLITLLYYLNNKWKK